MRIGLQADDARRADQIARVLRAAGHSVVAFSSVAALRKALRRDSFDMVVCEWTGRVPGVATLRWFRETVVGEHAIIMVAELGHAADVPAALNAGADDMLIMPLSDALLAARIEAVLRRCRSHRGSTPIERFGDYRFNTARRSITCRHVTLPATAKEYALVLMLFRNLGRPLSRVHLMEAVWGYAGDAQSRTLDAHVSAIRRRLRLLPQNGMTLRGIYGFGYRLDQAEPTHGGPP